MFIDLTTNPAPVTPGMPGGLTMLVHDALQKGATEALGNVGNPTNPAASIYWQTILDRALRWSYNFILQSLIKRGFSKVIIDQWDQGAEFQSDLGVWYSLQWLATQTTIQIEQTSLNMVDRRAELSGRATMKMLGIQGIEPVGITINGIWQWPDTNVGQVTTGPTDSLITLDPFDTNVSGEPEGKMLVEGGISWPFTL